MTVSILDETVLLRVAPGETSLSKASQVSLSEIRVADRVLLTAEAGNALRVVIMPASDIAQRIEAERQDWVKRGVSGVVTGVDGKVVTLRLRSMMGENKITVRTDEQTTYRRYAPDSVKFDDAKVSNLKEIHAADQLRARGEKSADGSQLDASEVVFGSFQTVAGNITSIDLSGRVLTVQEMATKRVLTVHLTGDSEVKAFPDLSKMMVGRGGMSPMGGGQPGGMGPGGRMPNGVAPPDMAQMLEQLPSTTLAELNMGETVVISSTKGSKPNELTAIMLLGNGDTFIRMVAVQQAGGAGSPGDLAPGSGTAVSGLGSLDLSGMTP